MPDRFERVFSCDEFSPAVRRAFGNTATRHAHSLAADPLFTDAGLADLLDRYPRDRVGVYSMGDGPRSWRRGRLGDISGAELVQAVKDGNLWLNLRGSSAHDDYIDGMNQRIFGELKRAMPGFTPFRTDLGLLISSPGARVYYHLDVPRVMLFHVRGHKRVFVYPREAPYMAARDLEAVVSEKTEEEIPYHPDFDTGGQVFDLEPGEMLSWPQNGPHRIENGNDLNVSLSIEYMTPAALLRANAVLANAWLRERFGYEGGLESRPNPGWLPKFALARLLRVIEPRHAKPDVIPRSFVVESGFTG
jgi:hypothetical protein